MSTVTLTGTFTRLDGTPATGTVKVTPSRSPIMDPDGKIVISGPQTFPLDAAGKIVVNVPASNDPDLGPPFTYTVEALLSHNPWKISKVWIPHGPTTIDISTIADYTPLPGEPTRTVTVPADGEDGQVLVWDGAGFSWDYPPTGPQGPKGDLDAEQLAGAPRLTNKAHDITWAASGTATIDSQTARTVTFTATAQYDDIRVRDLMAGGATSYFTAEVKTTSDRVFLGSSLAPVYHSGSGDWERLTGTITPSSTILFMVRDNRTSGWDQIEVRDPVLINLTEVFGAGREPTIEYMDELLAKHGNYIGGVDQFAFGDALQALTVAGPGMTLRHDTSVGTRVFLDHPGGSTMVYGDTGWRDITSLLHEEWEPTVAAGQFRIMRQNNTVTLAARIRRAPDSPPRWPGIALPLLNTENSRLPSGFAQHPTYGAHSLVQVLAKYIGQLTGNTYGDELHIRARSVPDDISWTAGDLLGFQASWTTSQDWPTTLPGDPS